MSLSASGCGFRMTRSQTLRRTHRALSAQPAYDDGSRGDIPPDTPSDGAASPDAAPGDDAGDGTLRQDDESDLGVLPGQVGDAAGGRESLERGVSPVMVVDVEPGVKGGAAAGF